jgi:hypothetical protein
LLFEKFDKKFLTLGLLELVFLFRQVIFISEKNVLAFRQLSLKSVVGRTKLIVRGGMGNALVLLMCARAAKGRFSASEIRIVVVRRSVPEFWLADARNLF